MPASRPGPKMTLTTQIVLTLLLSEPDRERYGLELSELAGLATGTIHPILARLEGFGWVISRWEDADPKQQGRPRRRYYRVNPDNAAVIRAALARAESAAAGLRRLRPNIVGGVI
jgi:PadR family transcriptional regulator PadR